MTSKFNLNGLSKKKSVTCSVIGGSQELFWPKVEMAQDRFDAFWNYYDTKNEYLAEIEHEGLRDDGTPVNPVLINIEEL